MKAKLKGMATGIFLLALSTSVWQCTSWLNSGTLRLTYYIKDDIHSVENQVEKADVDLSENEDWREHHDEVKGINRFLFGFGVINLADEDATAQFYVSEDGTLTTAAQVKDLGTLILDGVLVPAQDTVYVAAKDSYRYLQRHDQLEDFLLQGQFYLYCIANNTPFEIQVPDSAALLIDFTYAIDWEF